MTRCTARLTRDIRCTLPADHPGVHRNPDRNALWAEGAAGKALMDAEDPGAPRPDCKTCGGTASSPGSTR